MPIHINVRCQSMFQKNERKVRKCFQNRLSALVLHNNIDVNFDVQRAKTYFGRKHWVFAFLTICSSITIVLVFPK